jgi:nitrile hydratase
MNGIHDMGGMHGMGPIEYEKDEPVFHARWEARVYAMNRAMGAWRKWTLDQSRHGIEQLAPADYLRMSYYEKWFVRLINNMIKTGLVSQEEVQTGRAAPGSAKATPPLTAEMVPKWVTRRNSARRTSRSSPRFKAGQRVRARNIHPTGHTRLPRYARGRVGTIDRIHGVFLFPDTNAHGLGEKPQHVYSVRFTARELWGEQVSPRDSVYIDLWEDYLEKA